LQRIPKIMTKNADEHLSQPISLQELLSLFLERNKDVNLAPKDVSVDRLEQVVDGTDLISLEHARLLSRTRRDEYDWHVARFFDASHERRKLKPIHFRHLNVKDSEGDIPLEKNIERGASRECGHDLDIISSKHPFEREEVVRDIIDDEHNRKISRRASDVMLPHLRRGLRGRTPMAQFS